jgi:NTP pyrophosphatase (non-canonical NTP hydrolase)
VNYYQSHERKIMPYLNFDRLRRYNVARCEEVFHPLHDWSPAEWGVALAGEVGEACNLIKKLRRYDDGTNTVKDPPNAGDCVEFIGDELADVVIYADLLAARLGIDLGKAVKKKFNSVSQRMQWRGGPL